MEGYMGQICEYRDPRAGEVVAFLSGICDWTKRYSDGEVRFRPCPHCGSNKPNNPATTINEQTGLYRCFACEQSGNYYGLTKAFGRPLPESDRYKTQSYKPVDLNVAKFFSKQQRRPIADGHYPELLEYCIGRGISPETLNAFRCSSQGPYGIRFPLYQYHNGQWVMVNSKVRSIKPDAKTKEWFEYKGADTSSLIGIHLLDPQHPDKRCFIFEGQWDAMTAYELGYRNVFSLPNGASPSNIGALLRYIPNDFEVVIASDMDEAGNKCAEMFFAKLAKDKISRLRIKGYKDLNEWALKDAELAFSPEKLLDCIVGRNSFFLQSEGYMAIDMDEKDDDELRIVCKTPFPSVNKLLGGLYESQTTGILAPSGCGKTTFVNNIALDVAKQGIHVGLISLEGDRRALRRSLRDMIKHMAEPHEYELLSEHLAISNLEGIDNTVEDYIKELKGMIARGCRLLIFDNIDFACRGDNMKKVELSSKLMNLAVKNHVHLIMPYQCNKVAKGQIVTSGNQKGFSQFFQDSDNYLTLNQSDGYTLLTIEKNRENSYLDTVVLEYDYKSRTYIDKNFSGENDKNGLHYTNKVVKLF
jgi:hypothetical protein